MRNSRKKFRIHRHSAQESGAPDTAAPQKTEQEGEQPDPQNQPDQPDQQARSKEAKSNRAAQSMNDAKEAEEAASNDAPEAALTPRAEINRIKKENLTGRQLRIARRLAQKHGLTPTSDLDAVRLLRKRGIDPFNRGEMMETGIGGQVEPSGLALPATVRKAKGQVGQPQQKPQAQIIDDDTREREVRKIQRGLVKRRRRRLAVLMIKLACYVMLPSIIAGYYYYRVATPMYSTFSQIVIQQAEAPGAVTGGLFAGSPFATATDSILVQGYLTSRDAMLRLDKQHGFRAMFQGENIDPLQRLADDASNEDAYSVYEKRVIIGFDPTEGVIKMEVVTPSPERSLEISRTLISYAEERVDQQTIRLRQDTMKGAQSGYDDAEKKLAEARDDVANLQRQLNSFDVSADFSLLQGQIGELEAMILEKELERAELTANSRPNATKLRILDQKLVVLENKLEEKRQRIIQGSDGEVSIVEINAQLNRALGNLELRQELLAVSLASLETSRVEASRQTRYLSLGVEPVQSDQAAYPRAFENTLLSIIIFAGIYLIISLTVSILREQVTT